MFRITDEMVEVAAQAIQRTFANRSGRGREWHQLPPSIKQSHRDEARAALAAVRKLHASALSEVAQVP